LKALLDPGRLASTLDVFPDDLTAPLINQYLQI
jgi:hypothetical protein